MQVHIENLPVSKNFIGNFMRLAALIYLKKSNEKSKSNDLNENEYERIELLLLTSKKYFEQDNSQWGLGLTYSLLGRVKIFYN
jgi:hypothetical protein